MQQQHQQHPVMAASTMGAPPVASPTSKKKGKYDITFKLKVIQWAEKHSNRAAGSKFGLNESTIRGWRKSAVGLIHARTDCSPAGGSSGGSSGGLIAPSGAGEIGSRGIAIFGETPSPSPPSSTSSSLHCHDQPQYHHHQHHQYHTQQHQQQQQHSQDQHSSQIEHQVSIETSFVNSKFRHQPTTSAESYHQSHPTQHHEPPQQRLATHMDGSGETMLPRQHYQHGRHSATAAGAALLSAAAAAVAAAECSAQPGAEEGDDGRVGDDLGVGGEVRFAPPTNRGGDTERGQCRRRACSAASSDNDDQDDEDNEDNDAEYDADGVNDDDEADSGSTFPKFKLAGLLLRQHVHAYRSRRYGRSYAAATGDHVYSGGAYGSGLDSTSSGSAASGGDSCNASGDEDSLARARFTGLDARELARLSCSPSDDDSYYDGGGASRYCQRNADRRVATDDRMEDDGDDDGDDDDVAARIADVDDDDDGGSRSGGGGADDHIAPFDALTSRGCFGGGGGAGRPTAVGSARRRRGGLFARRQRRSAAASRGRRAHHHNAHAGCGRAGVGLVGQKRPHFRRAYGTAVAAVVAADRRQSPQLLAAGRNAGQASGQASNAPFSKAQRNCAGAACGAKRDGGRREGGAVAELNEVVADAREEMLLDESSRSSTASLAPRSPSPPAVQQREKSRDEQRFQQRTRRSQQSQQLQQQQQHQQQAPARQSAHGGENSLWSGVGAVIDGRVPTQQDVAEGGTVIAPSSRRPTPSQLKTISHQIPSKPFPEIMLPFSIIVYKSVADHYVQRYRQLHPKEPSSNPEQDRFAQSLGLERC